MTADKGSEQNPSYRWLSRATRWSRERHRVPGSGRPGAPPSPPPPAWAGKDCAAGEGAARDAPRPVGGPFTSRGTAGSSPRTGEGRAPCDGERRANISPGLGCEGLGEGARARPLANVSWEGPQQERGSDARPPAMVLRALSSGLSGDRHVPQCRLIRSAVKRRLNSGKPSPLLPSHGKLPARPRAPVSRPTGTRALCTCTCHPGGTEGR